MPIRVSVAQLPTRRDMSAMLDVVGRPIMFRCFVVTLTEERVKGLQDKLLVLLRCLLDRIPLAPSTIYNLSEL
jgi:hypothetical protein